MTNTPSSEDRCPHCGLLGHMGGPCPRIAAIEYHPDGSIKRVEYVQPQQLVEKGADVGYETYPMPGFSDGVLGAGPELLGQWPRRGK